MLKNWVHVYFNFFPLYLKINMDKTSQKVTKDPKRVEKARKVRENYMNKLKESILNDAKKGSIAEILAMQAMKLPALPPLPPALTTLPSQDPVILVSMVLVQLLSLS